MRRAICIEPGGHTALEHAADEAHKLAAAHATCRDRGVMRIEGQDTAARRALMARAQDER